MNVFIFLTCIIYVTLFTHTVVKYYTNNYSNTLGKIFMFVTSVLTLIQ